MNSQGAAAVAKPPPVNPNTTYSGSSDTTRYPGFRSPDSDPAAPAASGAPAASSAAPAAPTQPPGVVAALAGGINRNRGVNASPLQDIAGALALGRPISDASWAAAGYGPGGAALVPTSGGSRTATVTGTTPIGANQQAGTQLSNINSYSAAFPQPTPTSTSSANQAIGGSALSRISSAFNTFR